MGQDGDEKENDKGRKGEEIFEMHGGENNKSDEWMNMLQLTSHGRIKLNKNFIHVRRNCLLVVETWERINQLFGYSKQHTHNSAK